MPVLPLAVVALFGLSFAYIQTQDYKHHRPASSVSGNANAKVLQVKPITQQPYHQNAPLETVDSSDSTDASATQASPTGSAASANSSNSLQPSSNNSQTSQQVSNTSLIKSLIRKLSP